MQAKPASQPFEDPRTAAIEDKISELLLGAGPLQPVLDYLLLTRGKRLRPLLVLWTSEACSAVDVTKPKIDDVLSVAAIFELVHMASLVHDDIIDGSAQRRGVPTVQILWGLHSAVLAGDYLFTRANRAALKYESYGVASLVNQSIELLCEGEVAQDSRLYDYTVSVEEYFGSITKKTASLFGAACQAGASLGGAGRDLEESMLRFGIDIGCAFQIVDDVMDLCADPRISGKPACGDLRSGVMTLPLILAMETPAGSLIKDVFLKRDLPEEAAARIREACESHHCLSRAKNDALRLADSALSRLRILPPSPAKATLTDMARAMADRMA